MQELKGQACEQGLIPSKLGGIYCEADFTANECPPTFSCPKSEESIHECSVSQYGSFKFKQAWTERGSSSCIAGYLLRKRACLYANAKNKLKPSMLGKITCKENP